MAVTVPYNWIDAYVVRAKLREPLHVGSSEKGNGEVLVHLVKKVPFVQASGIAGVFRACYEGLFGESEESLDLFGDNVSKAGRIRFTDGIYSGKPEDLKMELRPRIKIDSVTGTSAASRGKGLDSESGQKFEMEYVGAGQEICFQVYVYSSDELDKSDSMADQGGESTRNNVEQERIKQVFAQIHSGQVQFGGQKSNGCGSMEIISLKHRAFDMRKREDRSAWTHVGDLVEDSQLDGYVDIHKTLDDLLSVGNYSLYQYRLVLDAQTEGSLLVKSIALGEDEIEQFSRSKEKEPDYVNMKSANGHYIVPGSSVKGAVRAQVERIASYLEKHVDGFQSNQVIADLFGRVAKKNDTGSAGNVRFKDILVEPITGHKKEQISNRIHIDRFTGGVMNTGLFKEQAVHGGLSIEAVVMKDKPRKEAAKEDNDNLAVARANDEKQDLCKADRSCGLLILALRDLALGAYNLGSGYSVGRGFLRTDHLKILRSDGNKAIIHFRRDPDDDNKITMEVEDSEGIIAQCMKALTKKANDGSLEEAGREDI